MPKRQLLGMLDKQRAGSGHFQILVRVEIIVANCATPRFIGRFLVVIRTIIRSMILRHIISISTSIFCNWLTSVGVIRGGVDENERKQKGGVGEHHIPRHGPRVRARACTRSAVLLISLVLLQRLWPLAAH